MQVRPCCSQHAARMRWQCSHMILLHCLQQVWWPQHLVSIRASSGRECTAARAGARTSCLCCCRQTCLCWLAADGAAVFAGAVAARRMHARGNLGKVCAGMLCKRDCICEWLAGPGLCEHACNAPNRMPGAQPSYSAGPPEHVTRCMDSFRALGQCHALCQPARSTGRDAATDQVPLCRARTRSPCSSTRMQRLPPCPGCCCHTRHALAPVTHMHAPSLAAPPAPGGPTGRSVQNDATAAHPMQMHPCAAAALGACWRRRQHGWEQGGMMACTHTLWREPQPPAIAAIVQGKVPMLC